MNIIITINGNMFPGRMVSPPGHFFITSMETFAEMLTKFTDLKVTITWSD